MNDARAAATVDLRAVPLDGALLVFDRRTGANPSSNR